jgi:death-on-curing protein
VRYLSLAEVLLLHRLVMVQARQQPELRDLRSLESAVAQPRQAFGGRDLYPSLAAKTAALGFSLIQNHAFVDGNKRVGHAAMVVFLKLNSRRLDVTVDEAERTILQVASGDMDRAGLQAWVAAHEAPA